MIYEKKQILVTVKAYPNPSRTYGETVCCAGIDLSSYQWIRLYPIPYRDLDDEQKFRKYSVIEIDCAKAKDDKRPESFKVNPDTIKVSDWLDTKDDWEKRKAIIRHLPVKSMCQVYREARENDLSLGFVKPVNISFEFMKRSITDQKTREECYAQLSFFNKKKKVIEVIPYHFYYNFQCLHESGCPGHQLSIIDWEIGQAFRDWRYRYDDEKKLLEMIQKKWVDVANTDKKDVYFYVGNMKRFRMTFMVLGVFNPPRIK